MWLILVQVCRNKDGSITLKLADFGLAMEVVQPIFTVCGTPTYVAPEILAEIGKYSILGSTMYNMMKEVKHTKSNEFIQSVEYDTIEI